jgi:F420-dependent hydroxymycolic acid dehydrogenase
LGFVTQGGDILNELQKFVTEPSEPRVLDRRNILKSVGALVGASAISKPFSGLGGSATAQNQPQKAATGGLRKRMMGFMLPHEQFRVTELLEFGVAAEQAGFDLLATSDHFQPWQANEGHSGQAWVTMGAIGQRTQRIWMGPTVTCPTFRYNPAVVAEAFASLSFLYPGRIFLGIGSGEALNEQAAVGEWPKWQERSERLIEAADIIRRLWTGEPISHKGKYYAVNARLYDRPARPIPLLMAANGPKAMLRCGRYADGLITDPKTWKQHKSEFETGAREAGKDPSQMPVLVEQYVVVGDKKDAEQAAQLWRFGPKAFTTYYNVRDPQEIQRLADKEVPLEKVYADWPISEDAAVHLKTVTELFDSGVSIVNIHTGQQDQRRVIDFYGKQVLPRVKTADAAT